MAICRRWYRVVLVTFFCLCFAVSPALAGINDDAFDGNIYALYAGNGALVPPRVTLKDSFNRKKPAILVFYVDDSSDCKQFASVVSGVQAFYGRAADILPINVDTMPVKSSYERTEPGYYYNGVVPESVIIDGSGKVVLDAKGQVSFDTIDAVFRQVFDLLPSSESKELKRRSFNEFNSELSN
ncbi:MAG TPA: thylakoid membrane photosystem I accumulation factor [Halomicronema sp.]